LDRKNRYNGRIEIGIANIENLQPEASEQNEISQPLIFPRKDKEGTIVNAGPRLSLYRRLALRLLGQVYIEHRIRPGWSGSLPFYAFNCPVHGVVEDYPHGYKQRLDCPICMKEEELFRNIVALR